MWYNFTEHGFWLLDWGYIQICGDFLQHKCSLYFPTYVLDITPPFIVHLLKSTNICQISTESGT